MPRGADFDDGKPQSDNAVDAGENKVHGVGKVDRQEERVVPEILEDLC
jgi:hypothetical protein